MVAAQQPRAPRRRTKVVGPDLERLLLPHQQPHFLAGLVLQQLDLPDAALLPIVAASVVPVQLALAAAHRKGKQGP